MEEMYLDELLVHRYLIDEADRARARRLVASIHGDPQAILRALTTDRERERAAYAEAYDAASVDEAAALLAGLGRGR